jgi:hypothetical protein
MIIFARKKIALSRLLPKLYVVKGVFPFDN